MVLAQSLWSLWVLVQKVLFVPAKSLLPQS